MGYPTYDLSFNTFTRVNRERCEDVNGFNHNISDWSYSDWITACTGELGEAANFVKKLNRIRDGITGNIGNDNNSDIVKEKIIEELADTVIYIDLMITALGGNLETAITTKWNKTSEKIGYNGRKL